MWVPTNSANRWRELLRELWFSYCSSREMPFREWNSYCENQFLNSESCSENILELRELREWPFHSESVFPEIGVVLRLLMQEKHFQQGVVGEGQPKSSHLFPFLPLFPLSWALPTLLQSFHLLLPSPQVATSSSIFHRIIHAGSVFSAFWAWQNLCSCPMFRTQPPLSFLQPPKENTEIATLHNAMWHYFARFRLKICYYSWPPKSPTFWSLLILPWLFTIWNIGIGQRGGVGRGRVGNLVVAKSSKTAVLVLLAWFFDEGLCKSSWHPAWDYKNIFIVLNPLFL